MEDNRSPAKPEAAYHTSKRENEPSRTDSLHGRFPAWSPWRGKAHGKGHCLSKRGGPPLRRMVGYRLGSEGNDGCGPARASCCAGCWTTGVGSIPASTARAPKG